MREPLPETMLTEGYATRNDGPPVPDVILYDHEAEQTRLIIEVCKNTGFKHDLTKVIYLIEKEDYGTLEGFVYNYKTTQWMRYRKGVGGQATESSFSQVIQIDLGPFV